jgi:hypothetical protein
VRAIGTFPIADNAKGLAKNANRFSIRHQRDYSNGGGTGVEIGVRGRGSSLSHTSLR